MWTWHVVKARLSKRQKLSTIIKRLVLVWLGSKRGVEHEFLPEIAQLSRKETGSRLYIEKNGAKTKG